jgi:hypothetical protein
MSDGLIGIFMAVGAVLGPLAFAWYLLARLFGPRRLPERPRRK